MLLQEIRNIRSEKSDLRKFGITIGIVLGFLSGLLWLRGKDAYIIIVFISIVFILTGLIMPVILKPIQKAWMSFAIVLGWFMTRLILSILFYFIISPIGLIARLLGKKFLNLDFKEKKESYWIEKQINSVTDKKSCERQF